MRVAANAITGPEGKLYTQLKYIPIIDDSAPKSEASTIMVDNRLVNKQAVDAGVISNETTNITPTVCNDATVTKVRSTIIP